MDIAIDFDGTCVTHEFPKVGKDIGAAPILKRLVANGHNLILYTMRSNFKGKSSPEFPDITGNKFLTDALNWFRDNDIQLYGIQTNPTQIEWTHSPKCYAQLYIDDAALGCPLIQNDNISLPPFVDWDVIENWLELNGII